jgi:hypothetical protein
MIGTKHEDFSSQLDGHDQHLFGVVPDMTGTEKETFLGAPL